MGTFVRLRSNSATDWLWLGTPHQKWRKPDDNTIYGDAISLSPIFLKTFKKLKKK